MINVILGDRPKIVSGFTVIRFVSNGGELSDAP